MYKLKAYDGAATSRPENGLIIQGTDVEQGAKRRRRRQGASIRQRIRHLERHVGRDLARERDFSADRFSQVRAELGVAFEEQRCHSRRPIPADQRIMQRNGEVVIDFETARVLIGQLITGRVFEPPTRGIADAQL